MKFIGIIPARYSSARFPGKSLVMINGKMMVQRVYEQAQKVLDYVLVATDDNRIAEAVKSFGGNVIMTSKKPKTPTERCAEAIQQVSEEFEFDKIICIMGDEPFIYPEQIEELKKCIAQEGVEIATLVKPINNSEDIFSTSKSKVVLSSSNEILYMSRSAIPHIHGEKSNKWVNRRFFKHIPIYGYTHNALLKISACKPAQLELAEDIEPLRWLENGFSIKAAFTEYESVSIETKADLKKVQAFGLM